MHRFERGQIISLKIHGLGSGGEGVGYHDGYAVFVDGALPGEEVKVQLIKCQKRHGQGKLLSLLNSSPDRVEPVCPLFGKCGGCQLMHLRYEKQLEMKRQRVIDALSRIAKISCEVAPCLSSPSALAYRNKIQLPVKEKKLGLYAASSHDLVEIEKCYIHCPMGEEIYQKIKGIIELSEIALRHVLIKSAVNTGEALVILVTDYGVEIHELAQKIMRAHPQIKGVVQNVHEGPENVILGKTYQVLAGQGYVQEKLSHLLFKISPASFFQVNPSQAERLYAKALEMAGLTGKETVLDAYCGVGALSLFFAKSAKKVIGIEVVPQAIEDAKENAKQNGIENVTFICQPAEKWTETVKGVDVVLVNPPRKGCELSFLKKMVSLTPKRIIYISCDPATLARDLGCLSNLGYKIDEVQPFDLFPQTAHVESVVRLSITASEKSR